MMLDPGEFIPGLSLSEAGGFVNLSIDGIGPHGVAID